LGDKLEQISGRQPFHAVFSVEENSWQGQTRIQLRVRDLKPA
jgi:single-stranded-DNA-specific exonuclease